MNRAMFLSFSAGLAIAVALIVHSGWTDVAAAVGAVGWGLVVIIALRAAAISVAGLAWGCLLSRHAAPGPWLYVYLRWIREGINMLLPVAQVGGDLIGGRLLTFHGVSGGLAGASILIDLLLQASSQFVFTVLGFAALVAIGGDDTVVGWVGSGLVVAAPALAGFFLSQRYGLFKVVERWLLKLGERWPKASLGRDLNLHDAIQDLYSNRRGVLAGAATHMSGWFLGVGEVWLALHLMGFEVSLVAAFVLESLSQAVRGAAFVVPGALGVQEGGFIVLGHMFGIPAEAALAVSLIKRVPDVVLGAPALFAWHRLEGQTLRARQEEEPRALAEDAGA